MLLYNFDRIFKARGISMASTYLKKNGFSDGFATKIKYNRVKVLRLRELERLCLLLKCTPNDFLEWTPDDKYGVDSDHPLYEIQKTDKVIDITKILSSVPLDKLDEIEQMINEKINQE